MNKLDFFIKLKRCVHKGGLLGPTTTKKNPSVIPSSISSSGEPVALLEHNGIPLLQTEVFAGQAKEAPLLATTFGPRLKKLKSHFNVLLFESSHPVIKTLYLRCGGPGIGRVRVVGHLGGKGLFS